MRRARVTRGLRSAVAFSATWLVVVVFITPYLWTLLTSFKSERDAATNPPKFFFTPTLDNYQHVLSGDIGHYMTNSIVITVSSTLICLLLAFPLAYALAIRPVLRSWRDILFFALATRMMPAAGVIVPIYMIAKGVGLLDTQAALIILYTTMNLPIAVWLLRTYLREVPTEVLEAARLDGAGTWVEMIRIAVPVTLPSIAATAVLCAVFAWNEFFLAVSLTAHDAGTLPVYLVGFVSSRGLFLAKLSAITVLVAIPTVVLGWLAQRRLVQGFALSQHG